MSDTLLTIKNLSVAVKEGHKLLVSGIDLTVKREVILALVGGSGSGKTTTGLSILKLLSPALTIPNGEIYFNNENILNFSESRMQKVRGKEIGFVFQEPLNAFNPVFRIGSQIDEVLLFHTDLSARQRHERCRELLNLVGIKEPQRVAQSYPHQLSGGMRQRAMIAQAIAADPKLIIADEPTSNLDVTLQARIMDLFRTLRQQLKLSILLITHDLGMVSHLADEVAVLTNGKIVEYGPTRAILTHPRHPYTQMLMKVF